MPSGVKTKSRVFSGVDDCPKVRQMNKTDLAEFCDTTISTITNWTREGMPYLQKGKNRKIQWVYDAYAVVEWVIERRRSNEQRRREADPGPSVTSRVDLFTPQERKAWFDSEAKRQSLEKAMGMLIPIERVEEVVATSFSALAQGLQSLPDTIERRTGCDPDIVEAIQQVVESEMESLATRLATLAPVERESGEQEEAA